MRKEIKLKEELFEIEKKTMTRFIIIFNFFLSTVLFSQNPSIALNDAFPNLTFTSPLHLTHSGDGTNRIFVVQQTGFIKVFSNDSNVTLQQVKTFLNISNKISSSTGEEGLLGLAFHPDYSANGYFYVNYTAGNPLRTVISRFKVLNNDPNKADSLSEYKILEINQPFSNHNGGTIMFGLDGYLYIGMGDGGSGGDPQNNAQNLQVLLGKILRINVNDTSDTKHYTIPTTNPFYGNPTTGMEEIFAYGFRNPWKFSQDITSGLIYVADVGQNNWEEINILQAGKNYGWRVMEGFSCFNPPSGCDTAGKTLPIKTYNHSSGDCSITGGYVYRGNRRPDLRGAYIYADYCSGKIWMLRYDGSIVTSDSLLIDTPYFVGSFGIDQYNELYILNTSANGKIYRFNSSATIGINSEIKQINDYQLFQNYPNPFNQSSIIRFQCSVKGYALLKFYDISGREVGTLVDQELQPGAYEVKFNGNSLTSGVYYYSLSFNGYLETKSMVLVK